MFKLDHFKAPALAGIALAAALIAPTTVKAADVTFDVAGVSSNDEFLSDINEVYLLNVGANAQILTVSWNVTIFADDPSYLSEAQLAFSNVGLTDGVFLTVGIGDDAPGTQTYSGFVDLVANGLSFAVDADGLLRLEFFEGYDDYPGDWDAIWESGSITFGTSTVAVPAVPEPSTYAMLALGLAGVGVVARRRRAQA